MKLFFFIVMALLFGVSAQAQVGVSVSVGEPGFYGQIDIGNYPRPELVYPQPVMIAPAPVGVMPPPIYLHVPPGQEKHWGKHCYRYNACGRPVYFVRDRWYNNVYVPEYRTRRGHREGWHDEHHDGRHDEHHGYDHGEHGEHGYGR